MIFWDEMWNISSKPVEKPKVEKPKTEEEEYGTKLQQIKWRIFSVVFK